MRARGYLVLTLLLAACDGEEPNDFEPDFSKPGNDNGVVQGEPARGAEYHFDRVLPALGECGGTHTVLTTVRQQVFGCEGYDHGPLYERARIEAENLATVMSCPDQCAPPVTWVSFHRWGCVDLFAPFIASASVEVSALCPLEPAPPPESLPAPDPESLVGQNGQEGGPAQQEPGLFDEVGGTFEVQCNATELVAFDYYRPVTACAGIDYEAHVDQALMLAQDYHGSIPCATGCSREAFAVRRREWTCEEQNGQPTVGVRVLFDVRCTSP